MYKYLSILLSLVVISAPVAVVHPTNDATPHTEEIRPGQFEGLPIKGHVVRRLGVDGAITIDVLIDESNLGSNFVEVANVTIWPGTGGGAHSHNHFELFYILSGGLSHSINGETVELFEGDIAIARPGETVQHGVIGSGPLRMLGIWAEAGEIDDLVSRFGFPESASGGVE